MKKTLKAVAPSTVKPAGWDVEDIGVELVYKVDDYLEGEENPFNSLYADNRGRFFLAQTDKTYDPMDMPWTAFHEVSFEQALEWAIHAQNYLRGSEGDMVKLLEHALKICRKTSNQNLPQN
jgi:hypothetical protein